MTTFPKLRTGLTAAFLALLAVPSTQPGRAQGGNCMSNSEVQQAVSNGEISPVSQVLSREGIPSSTQVLSVKVCGSGGRLNYVLAILGQSGEARNITVPAN